MRKFADAAQNSLRDVPKMQEVPVDGPRAREQEIDADAQELALAFHNIPALFAWAGELKALALDKLIDVVPQQVMDFETGVLSKCRTCFTGIDSSAVGVQRSTSDDSGASLPFQRARATFRRVMSELKVQMDERLEALKQERNLAGCEERTEEDLADLIRVAKEVSDLFSTAEIDGQTTRVACETTQQEWKSRGVKQPCQSALTFATTVHERVELFKSSWRERHGQRAWPDKNRQLGQLKNMRDEVMSNIAKNADMDDLQCIVQLCGLLQVLEETEMVLKEHPQEVKKRRMKENRGWVKTVQGFFQNVSPECEEWIETEIHTSRWDTAYRTAATRHEELLKTAAEWLSSGTATVGFRGWEAHITEMQNYEQQKSMNRIQFTRIIWFEALVYRVDRSSEHRWLALLEDALCREVQRVGADLKIAKNALRFGKLRTSLEEARDMVRFVFGPWQCLREVSGNLERTVSNRLEDTTYDAFELLRSSFDDGLKQFLWRAVLCQLAPGTQVVEDERGRPNHLKSEMAFRMLRESTQVLSCAGKLFDTKVKEAEEFLLMHQDASARTQQALQRMFVEEHINTIQKDVIARLQVVVDELPTPGGVKKMQDYFPIFPTSTRCFSWSLVKPVILPVLQEKLGPSMRRPSRKVCGLRFILSCNRVLAQ